MKQKYFLTFLVSFGFILTFGQNNAINLTGNNGFSFSGPNGTTNYALNATNFTVEYDFYLNAPAYQNARFSSVAAGNSFVPKPIEFYIDGTGNSILTLGDGTNTETIPGTPSFSVGQWYHVAFAVNNTATKNIKMYVNGVPVVDYNFTVSLVGNSTSFSIGFGAYPSTMDCKFDNLRIWSSLRTDTEIATNYNSCLNNNEPNLDYYFNFERSNNAIIKNQVINQSCKIGVTSANSTYSTGTGCTIPYVHAPITVTGDYAGIYYYVDDVNGKPHYTTDDFECSCINAESLCDFANSNNNNAIYEIYWDNTQWVLVPGDCVWLFTSCANITDFEPSLLATNTTDSPLAPCTGWVFDQATASGTFTSDDCPALSNTSFNSEGFTLYPNPSKGIFLITSNEALSLEVFDLIGNTILDQKMDAPTTSFDLSKNAKGVYILKVTDKNGNASFQRIIKE
ncbi:T9SS type A sorting domain-containing protein [Flavobacterium sp. TP390]|uniref:T9SS type A sorting domain-containing protein n=1 Tax=Flavobacterium profundi TaxID=1774945 RepID=A0A6I4IT69_9FLAO|nr:LamG-like jellyroll fold domain-containing protein [Flavobacterium profundi]MVO10053.1 T9SS type A sorting domain-containing protein [Flavobacterium profundi]